MRNPDRIPIVIDELHKYWTAHPDLRLAQIIVNLSERLDAFYFEDDQLLNRLKQFSGNSQ